MLKIVDLHACVGDRVILQGLNLEVDSGEIHAIMGPNGSGKSTLSKVLIGHSEYLVTEGSIEYKGKNLLDMDVHERALEGIFMSYQYPVEIPGVNNAEFLRIAYNAKMKHLGKEELDAFDFEKILQEKMTFLRMNDQYKQRAVNEGFSGGEKKKNEVLQLAILEPQLVILDELDSGLDIDALKQVSESVNALYNKETAFIIITHFPRILQYIKADHVHVMHEGRFVQSGDIQLAHTLEQHGYDHIFNKV